MAGIDFLGLRSTDPLLMIGWRRDRIHGAFIVSYKRPLSPVRRRRSSISHIRSAAVSGS